MCSPDAEDEEHHGPPRPPPRIPNGQPNPFLATHRARLEELREEFVTAAHGPRGELQEEAEWQELPPMLRFFVLTSSGLDDPDAALQRRWREHPDSERRAIRATLREWLRVLRALGALTL